MQNQIEDGDGLLEGFNPREDAPDNEAYSEPSEYPARYYNEVMKVMKSLSGEN